jgi:hypothetical protein
MSSKLAALIIGIDFGSSEGGYSALIVIDVDGRVSMAEQAFILFEVTMPTRLACLCRPRYFNFLYARSHPECPL